MSARARRVEQLIRREVAEALLRGELRDPRVAAHAAEISVTGVKVAPDLGSARVFVDVLGAHIDVARVLAGLNAGAHALRGVIGPRLRTKRTPSLRFEHDTAIAQGSRIEQVLAEIHADEGVSAAAPEGASDSADDD